ncbi:MAG: response regulator transcription factor [Gracilimonas sp.]|nr:response regulator transcription factor [Gracilimonas sp.]
MQSNYRLISQVLKRDRFRHQHTECFRQLTEREVEVLQLLAAGLNNPKIAQTLSISRYTVETHRKHLNRKLDIRSYNKLVKYALAFDLIEF